MTVASRIRCHDYLAWIGCLIFAACNAPSSSGKEDLAAVARDGGTATTFPDLVFRTIGGKTLAGDLYLPAANGSFPVVVVIHGGGFQTGDKAGKSEITWAEELIANGFAAFSINYRLVKDFSNGEVPFPSPLHDTKCAIMWLRKNAGTYHLDKTHVFVFGSSAGGWFTNMLGATGDEPSLNPECPLGEGESNRVQGAVTYFGPSDFNALFSDPARQGSENGETGFLGTGSPCTNPAESSGICTTASPTHWIDANDPPYYITHSDDDPTVPVSQGRLMSSLLKSAGVDVTYHEVTGEGHGWHAKFISPVVAQVRDEVLAWLKARK